MPSITLATRFPRLYHMTELGSWPSIQRHGLLSTTAILDLAGVAGDERVHLESNIRPESVALQVGVDAFVIRDQKPLNLAKLESCLVGATVAKWLQLLNRTVFFWPTRQRCEELSRAKAYRHREHLVLEVDTAALVARHGERMAITPINTGSVLFRPARRGPATFRPIGTLTSRDRVAEVSVDYAVPDIAGIVVATHRIGPATPLD